MLRKKSDGVQNKIQQVYGSCDARESRDSIREFLVVHGSGFHEFEQPLLDSEGVKLDLIGGLLGFRSNREASLFRLFGR